jgi:AcrR family transcriptional regulator
VNAERVHEPDPVPPPPWQRSAPGSREADAGQRREPITQEAIVETALRLLDRDGLDALSMRRVADELGTGAASLYWHVADKDRLLDLIFDRVVGEHDLPDPDPERWTEQLKDVARQTRAAIARHRDIVRISLGRFPAGPNAIRFNERLLAILRAGDLPDRLALTATHLLMIVVNGFAVEAAGAAQPPDDRPSPHDMAAMVSDYYASLPPDRFPNLVAVATELTAADMDERFELLLDLVVAGLATRSSSNKPESA